MEVAVECCGVDIYNCLGGVVFGAMLIAILFRVLGLIMVFLNAKSVYWEVQYRQYRFKEGIQKELIATLGNSDKKVVMDAEKAGHILQVFSIIESRPGR